MKRILAFVNFLSSRIYMYLVGVHFHPSNVVSDAVAFKVLRANSNYGDVMFSFYRLSVTQLSFRFGKIYEKPYRHYYIHAAYPSGFPINRFGQDKVVLSVRGDRLSSWSEEQICRMLMNVYLSYIEYRLA